MGEARPVEKCFGGPGWPSGIPPCKRTRRPTRAAWQRRGSLLARLRGAWGRSVAAARSLPETSHTAIFRGLLGQCTNNRVRLLQKYSQARYGVDPSLPPNDS